MDAIEITRFNEPNLVPVDGLTTYPNPQMGVLSTLLQWYEQDPPDAFERRRNESYMIGKNRNPFIDYPEFVNYIYNEEPMLNAIQIENVQTRINKWRLRYLLLQQT